MLFLKLPVPYCRRPASHTWRPLLRTSQGGQRRCTKPSDEYANNQASQEAVCGCDSAFQILLHNAPSAAGFESRDLKLSSTRDATRSGAFQGELPFSWSVPFFGNPTVVPDQHTPAASS